MTVYGPNDRDSGGLKWQCFVDEIPVARDGSDNSLVACLQERLIDGPHTLRVNVDITTNNQTFYFDRVQYAASPTANLENQTILVQQTDPIIQYDTRWTGEYPSIVRITNENGATARLSFIGNRHLRWCFPQFLNQDC